MARAGMLARGVVYLLLTWLTVEIAAGRTTQQANDRGAFAEVASHTGGRVVLALLGVGLALYALWRAYQAVAGSADERSTGVKRLRWGASAVAYGAMCVAAFSFVVGGGGSDQAQQQQTWTARLMSHDAGRWLVGAVGAAAALIGLAMIATAVAGRFDQEVDTSQMSRRTAMVVTRMGIGGEVVRGIVVAISGGLIVDAAVTYDASKSRGLDGALRTLAGHSYGSWLLGLIALGLAAFGLYSVAAARWVKV